MSERQFRHKDQLTQVGRALDRLGRAYSGLLAGGARPQRANVRLL